MMKISLESNWFTLMSGVLIKNAGCVIECTFGIQLEGRLTIQEECTFVFLGNVAFFGKF